MSRGISPPAMVPVAIAVELVPEVVLGIPVASPVLRVPVAMGRGGPGSLALVLSVLGRGDR